MVGVLVGRGMSERRACEHVGVCRATVRYVGRPEDPVDVLIRGELRKLSGRYRRYGTPRMTELVRRGGVPGEPQAGREALEAGRVAIGSQAFA